MRALNITLFVMVITFTGIALSQNAFAGNKATNEKFEKEYK